VCPYCTRSPRVQKTSLRKRTARQRLTQFDVRAGRYWNFPHGSFCSNVRN
jgi:hypothetical protein